MFLKYSCQKSLKKYSGKTVFLKELQAAINFSKVSLDLNKIPNYLKQVFRHIQKYAFCVCYEKSPPEGVAEDWSQSAKEILWRNWWQCDEIHIIVNLGQKYEDNLGY